MKPKTKLQIRVAELSSKLPEITEDQKMYAYKHCFEHRGYKCKGIITCMDCSTQWKDTQPPLLTDIDGCTCPGCGSLLKVKNRRKQKDIQTAYFAVITTCQEFQVIRFLDVYGYYKRGERPRFASCEIVQLWLSPDGKYETVARLKAQNFSGYTDSWSWPSSMEIRPKSNATCYSLIPTAIYPKRRCIPAIKRNGFRFSFHGLAPLRMFYLLLNDSKAETLLKAKQYSLLRLYTERSFKINNHWPSIKICMRNNYKVTDATIWMDYLDLLSYFRKDLRNAKFVCPKNLKKEHDRLVKKKRVILQREADELKKKRAAESEKKFRELKEQFFGVEFSDGLIQVRALTSVQEYVDEGDTLHHCVFTNNYNLRPDSLILSASMNGEKLETIEISLKSLKVVQCRGAYNKNTDYHDQILTLVNSNINQIRKKLRA